MSRNYKILDQQTPYFITFGIVNWIDVFTRALYRNILVDSINYCIDQKGLVVYAWVIMTNHVHMIIGTDGDKMQDIIRDLKKFTSKKILKAIEENPKESRREWMLGMFEAAGKKNSNNKKYQFWQQHNHPIALTDNRIIDQKLTYLHNNPVKAEIVIEDYEYKYSSAIDYADGRGLVKVTLLV